MKNKRSNACDIPQKVKRRVWERDGERCIICGNSQAMPNAHYISRAQGGLGIEENIVTLCIQCHNEFDNSIKRAEYKKYIENYLKEKYPEWEEKKLYYRSENND